MTWTDRQYDEAIAKVERGEKLDQHEYDKLVEASNIHGSRGRKAERAVQKYDGYKSKF